MSIATTTTMASTRFRNHHGKHLSLCTSSSSLAQQPASTRRLCGCMPQIQIRCSDSNPKRGFGPQKDSKANKVTTSREEKGTSLRQRKSTSQQSGGLPSQAPGLRSQSDENLKNIALDLQFEERLQAVRRSALEQKKAEENKEYGAIDYDTPVETERSKIGLGTKIGVGVAVVVFGLVFALGDFLPSGSVSTTEEATIVPNKISEEEKANLQKRLQQYEATLRSSPEDTTALEGTAVTLAELGEYTRAATVLEDLTKKKPNDPDAFRLLGEVKYEIKDYEGSAAAYKSSAMLSKTIDFEVLRGLTNTLLAAKKPDEAVHVLLASREHLNAEKSSGGNIGADSSTVETKSQVDPIQGSMASRSTRSCPSSNKSVKVALACTAAPTLRLRHDSTQPPTTLSLLEILLTAASKLCVHPVTFVDLVELLLGKAYSDWGHVSDAVSVYDQLISSHPDDFRGYLAKGIILKENGKVGDAERMFMQARFFAPEKAKALVDRYSRQ
ncbi:unnamed protein product [Ilex paraguariensis]|uniref:Uncharacterized protein n=1 Tax=Ilex paraguariensis TaxID=185542 RepID=A0ABC8RN13_9AQUA